MAVITHETGDSLLKELTRLKSAITIFRRFKRTLLNATDEVDLLNEMCRVAVQIGGYQLAWIGYIQPETPENLKVIAKSGDDITYSHLMLKNPGSDNGSESPAGIAIRNSKPYKILNIPPDSDNQWLAKASEAGICSVICFPLILKGYTFGAFTVITQNIHAFREDEEDMLSELVTDIPLGIAIIRQKEEHQRAENELKKIEARFSGVFENTGTGSILLENDQYISYANKTFGKITGYTQDEIINKMKWSDFVSDEDRPRMEQYHAWRRTQPGRAPDVYECKMVDKQGNIKNMLMKVGMIEGTKVSIASFMDITFAKRAQDNLIQRESQLSAIIENFEGFIYVRDNDYRIQFTNKTFTEHLGYDATGLSCYEIIHGLDHPCNDCMGRQIAKGRSHTSEIKNLKEGRWYQRALTPIAGSDNSVTKVQVILTDITDRKLAQEALKESEELLRKENVRLKSAIRGSYKFSDIVGKSPAMQKIYKLILRSASTDAGVIIYGESGTGKEMVAKAIHDMSDRKDNNFIPVNCGAISESIIESEFFGYKKGAFTGADKDRPGYLDAANNGTLFLDEIGEIPLSLQVKLLRAIDGGGYTPLGSNEIVKLNARIIAATNRDLTDLVKQTKMRKDFYYRIHIIPINLPPLRERKEDLPLLIDHFMERFCGDTAATPITGTMFESFKNYDWPGNVRELQNIIHRYISLKEFDFKHVLPEALPDVVNQSSEPDSEPDADLKNAMDNFEKSFILNALNTNRWQREATASSLGIHRKTLFTKMRKYGID